MLTIFSSTPFYTRYVYLPHENDPIPPEIHNNPKRYPFFRDAIGAIDGTHIACSPSEKERAAARNRKGLLTQNCLMACSFDLRFTYVLSGWEGSAADALVFQNARRTDFPVPNGKYYLADAGFPLCPELLVPFRGVRYHLAEWGRARIRYVLSTGISS
jgi:DDE superfamily endonuclease